MVSGMTHERDLCNLLIQMGLDRGVDVGHVTEELATLALPSFADTAAFRNVLVEAAETQLRLQMDERIRKLRQQLGVAALPSTQGEADLSATSSPPLTRVPAMTDQDEPTAVDENLPEDATVMWKTER